MVGHKDSGTQNHSGAFSPLRCVIVSLCPLFFLLSCSPKSNGSAAGTQDSLAIRMAVLPTIDCLPFYYAEQEGIYDSLGLNLKLETFASAMDADTAFCNKHVDAIASDMVKACIWKARGDSISVLMSGELKLYLMTAYSARIKQTSSLKEKIIGITRHSSVDMFTDAMLENAKFISTDLNKPQINNLALRCLMVDQNQYDGAVLPEPFASECEARGARRIFSTDDLALNLSAVIVHDTILNSNQAGNIQLLAAGYDIAVDRINRLVKDYQTAVSDTLQAENLRAPELMKYFPRQMTVEVPDSLVQYRQISKASMPSDSVFAKTVRWCNGRGLMKSEIRKEDIIYSKKH